MCSLSSIKLKHNLISPVEVWSKNNVRLAVNCAETKHFFTAKRSVILALNAVNFVRFAVFIGEFFFTALHRISYKKETDVHGFEPLIPFM